MTVIDTFTIDVEAPKTATAKEGLNQIDKKLDDMDKKGKKRSEDEKKADAEQKKRNKEKTEQLKDQQKAADELGNSFRNMISGAVGAVAAYASFSALKAGLIDANNLNNALLTLQQTYGRGVSFRNTKALGIALESATGIPASTFYNFAANKAAQAARDRVPFDSAQSVKNLRERFKNQPPEVVAQRLAGTGAEFLTPFVSNVTSDKQFDDALKFGFSKAGTSKDAQAAKENTKNVEKTASAFSSLATEINTSLHSAIKTLTDDLMGLAGALKGHPNVAAGLGVAGGIAVGGVGAAALRSAMGLLRSGAVQGAIAANEAALPIEAGEASTGIGIIPAILTAAAATAAGLWYGSRKTGSGSSVSSKTAQQSVYDFWRSKGYGPGAAAGWTANAQAESQFGLDPNTNSNGHYGIYQWSSVRREKIRAMTGIDVATAGIDDQLKAAAWEAQTMGLGPDAFPGTAGQSAALISNKFEIPSTSQSGLASEAARRARIAEGYGAIPTSFSDPGAGGGAGRAINIKIDDITIKTEATDAAGISRGITAELKNQIRMAISNIDDGVAY